MVAVFLNYFLTVISSKQRSLSFVLASVTFFQDDFRDSTFPRLAAGGGMPAVFFPDPVVTVMFPVALPSAVVPAIPVIVVRATAFAGVALITVTLAVLAVVVATVFLIYIHYFPFRVVFVFALSVVMVLRYGGLFSNYHQHGHQHNRQYLFHMLKILVRIHSKQSICQKAI